MDIRLKRVYDPPNPEDGTRILVDRLWPRGLAKENAKVDVWLKEIAPSTDLRKWFAHDPEKADEFAKRYEKELAANTEAVQALLAHAEGRTITLVYAAKFQQMNNAVAIKQYLMKHHG